MRHRDFCYWIQGCVELADPLEFTTKQIDCIKKHIELVEVSQKDVKKPSPHAGFFQSLKTIIGNARQLSAAEFAVVKKLLHAEFVHIDANTEGDQDEMDEAHHGRPPRPKRPPGTRC